MTIADRVDALDLTLFDGIPSQTSSRERRSLLAVQRAVARKHSEYTYLEIGSHLGGSLQPHYLDGRCTALYSIDARPEYQPDDRAPGHIAHYEDNSSERMKTLLRELDPSPMSKLTCIDSTVANVDLTTISVAPTLAFIDGEHTYQATLSDFQFCRQLVAANGVILFHDSGIILSAIAAACRELSHARIDHIPLQLEGTVFGIFLDCELVQQDDYLSRLLALNGPHLRRQMLRARIRRMLPIHLVSLYRRFFAPFRRSTRRPH